MIDAIKACTTVINVTHYTFETGDDKKEAQSMTSPIYLHKLMSHDGRTSIHEND